MTCRGEDTVPVVADDAARAAAAHRDRLTPLTLASGFPTGRRPVRFPDPREVPSPRTALEDAVRPAVRSGRCFVAFSGGRDSSAVLALATAVARAEGLPDPVPVTEVHPGLPGADESEWQDLVLSHLRLTERVVLTAGADDGYLGSAATASLRDLGLLLLPQAHGNRPVAAAAGGWLLTGEGGDEVLGPRRITPWNLLRLDRRLRSRAHARWLWGTRPRAAELWPRLARYGGGHDVAPWLRPAARARLREELRREQHAAWRFDAGTLAIRRRALVADYLECFDVVGRRREAAVGHPLLDPAFLVALARAGGVWGFRGRTDAMRRLFGDLLPEAVLARTTKATFNGSQFGEAEREFARTWDGAGVDHDLVDVDALRREWLGASPLFTSGVPLHAAWLASQRLGIDGRADSFSHCP
jgi:Asparagine synthase